MYFVIQGIDKPDSLALRLQTREQHLAYVGQFIDQILVAGPFLGETGDMIGSMLVMDFADLASANRFAEEDPYNKAGLFADVSVREWRKSLPAD